MAGLEPADVDVLMGYDSFTITALLHLEDLGFCKKGEGGPFAADGHLGPGGTLAMNTNGGGLSFTHPGMYGMFLLTEATRQLRGECGERQVDGRQGRGGPRLGHVPLGHVDRRARHRGGAVSAASRRRADAPDPLRAAGRRRERPLLGGHTRGPAARPVVHGVRPRRLLPACVLPALRGARLARSSGAPPAGGRPCTPPWWSTGPRPPAPPSRAAQPYCVALVDLEEGVRMLTNVVGCPPDEVHSGMAVTVTWEPLSDGRQLPLFEPAATACVTAPMSVPEDKRAAAAQGMLHAWWAARIPDRLAVDLAARRPHLRGPQRRHQPAGAGAAGPRAEGRATPSP